MKLYGRLGNGEKLEEQIKGAQGICKAAGIGCCVDRRLDAGIVEVTTGGKFLFKAILKETDIWIIMYNEEFYPRT